MRLIPVMDLLDGCAVHAVRGERHKYHPLESVLCDSYAPPVVAGAFRRLGLDELYIADLNAIQGRGSHFDMIAVLAQQAGLRISLDPGITGAGSAETWLASGVALSGEPGSPWRLDLHYQPLARSAAGGGAAIGRRPVGGAGNAPHHFAHPRAHSPLKQALTKAAARRGFHERGARINKYPA